MLDCSDCALLPGARAARHHLPPSPSLATPVRRRSAAQHPGSGGRRPLLNGRPTCRAHAGRGDPGRATRRRCSNGPGAGLARTSRHPCVGLAARVLSTFPTAHPSRRCWTPWPTLAARTRLRPSVSERPPPASRTPCGRRARRCLVHDLRLRTVAGGACGLAYVRVPRFHVPRRDRPPPWTAIESCADTRLITATPCTLLPTRHTFAGLATRRPHALGAPSGRRLRQRCLACRRWAVCRAGAPAVRPDPPPGVVRPRLRGTGDRVASAPAPPAPRRRRRHRGAAPPPPAHRHRPGLCSIADVVVW